VEEWVARIVEEAKSRAPDDLRDAFTLQVVEKSGDTVRIRFESDKRVMPYVRFVILKHRGMMPPTVRKIFENLLERIDAQLAEPSRQPPAGSLSGFSQGQ